MKLKRYLGILICFFSFLVNARGQLYSYTNSQAGTPASVATNAIGGDLTRVNGNTAPGSLCGTGFSSSNFTTATAYSPTLPAVNVDVTPSPGYQLNVTGFSAGLRRSGTGPISARMAYSVDNGTTWINQGIDVAPNNASCGSTTTYSWTLPTMVVATSLFKYRIYFWNASGTGGTEQILNLTITGTVTASLPACTTPLPATSFLYSVVNPTQTNISYAAPTGGASGYLVVISNNATLSAAPLNGTTYTAGTALGGGTVVYSGTNTSVPVTGLNPLLDYYYFIYPYNNTACIGGPKYATPLTGDDRSPIITLEPLPDTICAGTSAVYSVTAIYNTGYQWQEFITGWTNLTNSSTYAGTQTNTLTINGVPSSFSGRSYRCLAIGTGNINDTSAATSLIVKSAPVITTEPVAAAICLGADTAFSVTATGTNNNYQWQENAGTGFANISNSGVFSGATTNHLQITNPAASANGHTYRCIVYNSCSPADTSAIVTLTVNNLPVAAITTAGSIAFCQGGMVSLSTPSGANLHYQWLQNSSNLPGATQNQVTASAAGNYTVVVNNIVTGCTATSATQTVTVYPLPTATITPAGATTFCAGDSVILQSSTGTGWNYQWKLNGAAVTGATNSTVTATATGNYTMTITIATTGCTATATAVPITVNPLPAAIVTAGGPVTFCDGGSVVLTTPPANGLNYQWLQNGTNISGATQNQTTATTSGNYAAIATNTTTGCATTSNSLTVTANPLPIATITPSGATTFCAGNNVVLQSTTGTGWAYQWSLNSAPVINATNNSITAAASGNYGLITTITATGCSYTAAAIPVQVNPLPTATATATGTLNFCTGNNVVLQANTGTGLQYQWHQNATDINGASNDNYSAVSTGNYTVKVITAAGCFAISSPAISVTVSPLIAPFNLNPAGPVTACDSVSLTSTLISNGLTYQWQQNGVDIPGAVSTSYLAQATGLFTVRVTNSGGCTQTSAAVNTTINASPIALITYSSPLVFCEGGAVALNAYNAVNVSYEWRKNGLPLTSATSDTYVVDGGGVYAVKLVSNAGCTTVSAPISVTVNPLPLPVISRTGMTLSTGAYISYAWSLNNQDINGADSESYEAIANGGYAVTVTDYNGCVNKSAITIINNVGVASLNMADPINIYPNPVADILYIKTQGPVVAQVYDITGRQVINATKTDGQIDVHNLVPGQYTLRLTDIHQQLLAQKTFVVAHP